jgi:hypothetical protein
VTEGDGTEGEDEHALSAKEATRAVLEKRIDLITVLTPTLDSYLGNVTVERHGIKTKICISRSSLEEKLSTASEGFCKKRVS